MIKSTDLRSVAHRHLVDAQTLLQAQRYDAACYLSGFAIEVALKARICRTLNWPEFPKTAKEFRGLHSLKTHDLAILLRLSGVEADVVARELTAWTKVIQWTPEQRYQTPGGRTAGQAHDFVAAVTAILGVL